jgi:penicillin-binding protein 2
MLQVGYFEQSRQELEQMKILSPRQLPTVRGTIYDRKKRELAVDKPVFYLHVSYDLTRLMDDRFWEAHITRMISADPEITREDAEIKLRRMYEPERAKLMQILERFRQLNPGQSDRINEKIKELNDAIWRDRQFHAWARNFPDSPLRKRYREMGRFVPQADAIEEFLKLVPDPSKRMAMILKVDLAEMHKGQPLVELESEQELLEAQQVFVNVPGVEIYPQGKRFYPYGPAACQLIGRVWPAYDVEDDIFADDDYSSYQHGDVLGKFGAERVCEVILRGRRGEVTYDIEGKLLARKQTIFGKDVEMTVDIELQQALEEGLESWNKPAADETEDQNDYETGGIGAVVIEVLTGDVLAMISLPRYDLNTMRKNYNELFRNPSEPLRSKAIYKVYPPGSTVKPVIGISGLEENKISPGEVISCPPEPAPRGWPNCILFRKFHSCHDWKWNNHARNAIKGSCNIYFSHLANRLDSRQLQRWLYNFGYGSTVLAKPPFSEKLGQLERINGTDRNFYESRGRIYSKRPKKSIENFQDIPELASYEKRMFGIGQGSFRATALQVANAMATIARDGIFKHPRVFKSRNDPLNSASSYDLNLSRRSLKPIKDGMHAVVNENGGTAHKAFDDSPLLESEYDMQIYGKTGSTEKPYHAWFAGFVEDGNGRKIAISIIVEGGQAGSRDAAPRGEMIMRILNKFGYIGDYPQPEKISNNEGKSNADFLKVSQNTTITAAD